MRVAIIDNDPAFAAAIAACRGPSPVEVTHRALGEASVDWLRSRRVDTVLIDPGAVGPGFWDYLERLGTQMPDVGVLVCSEGADLSSRVRALRLAADDWITKPVAAEEVLARIEASTSPRGRPASPDPIVFAGEVEVRSDRAGASVRGRRLALTMREWELLYFLVGHSGRPLEREAIYQRVWGYKMVPGDRSIDTYVQKLRAKLEARSPDWHYIHTHFGIGYRFEAERHSEPAGVSRSA